MTDSSDSRPDDGGVDGDGSGGEVKKPRRRRIVLIGAGPTAIGALCRIQELKESEVVEDVEVCVLEQESEPGGLARSITDACGFTWDLGVHVTGASKYVEFLRLLQETIDEWNVVRRVVKADMSHIMDGSDDPQPSSSAPSSSSNATIFDGVRNYVPYPVQNSVPFFPDTLKRRCLADFEALAAADAETLKPRGDENFGEFSTKIFGPTVQSVFLRPYNEKVWTVKLEAMSCRWLEGRVPRVDLREISRRCALRRDQLMDEDDRIQSFFRYPAKCRGIGEIWRRVVAQKFPAHIFRFRHRVTRIDTAMRKVWSVNGETGEETVFDFDAIISTMPLNELWKACDMGTELSLKYSKVILVGIGLRLPQTPLATGLSWAYYPRAETVFYRCTVLSNFSDHLVPDPQRFWSVLCEIAVRPEEPVHDETAIIERTIRDLAAVGMISDETQVFSQWLTVLQYGYPVPTLDRDRVLADSHRRLAECGIYSRGRFGGWRYEISNQDHSFECGSQVADRVLLDILETLYEPNDHF